MGRTTRSAGGAAALLAAALLAGGCGTSGRGADLPDDPALYRVECEQGLTDFVQDPEHSSATLVWQDPITGARKGSIGLPDALNICEDDLGGYQLGLRFNADLTRVAYLASKGDKESTGWIDLASGRRREVAASTDGHRSDGHRLRDPFFVPGTDTFAYLDVDRAKDAKIPVRVEEGKPRRGAAIDCPGQVIPTTATAMARCLPSDTIANADGSILVTDQADGRRLAFPDSGTQTTDVRLPEVDAKTWKALPCTALFFLDRTRYLCANLLGEQLGVVTVDPDTKTASAVALAHVGGRIKGAALSPDGKTVAIDVCGDGCSIYTVPLTGGEPTKLPDSTNSARGTLFAWR